MKLLNRTHTSTEIFHPLIQYVQTFRGLGNPELLILSPGDYPGFEGRTNRVLYESGRTLYYVEVYVGEAAPYPYSFTYRKAAGRNHWTCWEEEFVHVLAHEFRHVAQWTKRIKRHHRDDEVDAEVQGQAIVADYRLQDFAKAA